MLPLIIVMPLAVAGGGLLGLAKDRFRRKRLSRAVHDAASPDMEQAALRTNRSVIVANVAAGISFVLVTGKDFVHKIHLQLKRAGDKILLIFTRIGDKSGAFGGVIAAMGCAACFPALASLGAAIGLGFLAQWEDLFMSTLIPFFAWIALLANALGWFSHRQWHRSLIGMAGPTLILLSLYPWFMYPWFKVPLFIGLFLMVAVAIWDLTSPAHRRCEVNHCNNLEA